MSKRHKGYGGDWLLSRRNLSVEERCNVSGMLTGRTDWGDPPLEVFFNSIIGPLDKYLNTEPGSEDAIAAARKARQKMDFADRGVTYVPAVDDVSVVSRQHQTRPDFRHHGVSDTPLCREQLTLNFERTPVAEPAGGVSDAVSPSWQVTPWEPGDRLENEASIQS